jgi:hypothetical protein
MVRMLYNYHKSHIMDIILFWAYKKNFENWNINWFRRLDSRLRYLFKQILRSHGVYTGPYRAYIGQQLADLLDFNEAPEWPKNELRKQGFIFASRFSEKGQEREVQRQIKRDQAAARLAELRATANTRAQNSAPNSTASSAEYQPRNSTADARRTTSAPDGPKHHTPHIAPRQMRVQPSIENLFGSANEQQNDYTNVQIFNQTAPETRSTYEAPIARKPYSSVPPFISQITSAPYDPYFDLSPQFILNKRLDPTKAAIMIKL